MGQKETNSLTPPPKTQHVAVSRAQEDTPIEIRNRDKKHDDEKVERPGKAWINDTIEVGRTDGTNMN